MAYGLHRDADTTCAKCGGPIVQNVTYKSWAPKRPEILFHKECYFELNPKRRGAHGRYLDENGIELSVAGAEPEGDGAVSTMPLKVPKPEVTESVPVSSDGLAGLLAQAVLPIIENKIAAKVDAEAVKKIAENAVLDCASILRDEFTTKIVIENRDKGETKELQGLQHKQFSQLLTLVRAGLNVFLYDEHGKGGPGAGKTTAAAQVAEALELPFYHISLNIQSQPSLIKGYKTATGDYCSTDYRKWYETGGVFLFDELDNANGNFLTSLNTDLANGSASFPDAIVSRHKDAICIAAGNTSGNGGNALHSSRQQLDAASRERFVFLAWQYDEKLERKVAIAHNAECEPWVSWIQAVRKAIARLNIKMVCSPRASIFGAQILKEKTFNAEQVADMVLFKGIDSDTKSKVLTNCPLPSFA